MGQCWDGPTHSSEVQSETRSSTGGFRIDGKTSNNLRYADDIVLLATSSDKLQELVNRVESAAREREHNLTIYAAKTKTTTNTEDVLEIDVGAKRLEQENSYVYL